MKATALRFRVNLNGDDRSTLVDHYLTMQERLGQLRYALRQAHPHGRNYQTTEDPTEAHRQDVDRFISAHKALDEVENLIADYGKTLVQ